MKPAVAIFSCSALAAGVVLVLVQSGKRQQTPTYVVSLQEQSQDLVSLREVSGSDKSSLNQRQGLSGQPKQESQSSSNSSEEPSADAAGVTNKQRLEYLVNSHDNMLRMLTGASYGDEQAAQAELVLVQRCVAAILHSKGRAEFLSNSDEKPVGFHLHAMSQYEHVFAADLAQYRFMRGEFPVCDTAYDLFIASREGKGRDSRPADFDVQVQDFYEQALETFGIPRAKNN